MSDVRSFQPQCGQLGDLYRSINAHPFIHITQTSGARGATARGATAGSLVAARGAARIPLLIPDRYQDA